MKTELELMTWGDRNSWFVHLKRRSEIPFVPLAGSQILIADGTPAVVHSALWDDARQLLAITFADWKVMESQFDFQARMVAAGWRVENESARGPAGSGERP